MSEVLFILTTIYVAYVFYKAADFAKKEVQVNKPSHVESIMTPSGSIPVNESILMPVEESASVAEAKAEEKEAEVKSTAVSSSNLKDPETGEAAKVTYNYRGLKRWLKEALVAEGLLEKVYSNSELNDETNAKIKVALDAIKLMPKYHV